MTEFPGYRPAKRTLQLMVAKFEQTGLANADKFDYSHINRELSEELLLDIVLSILENPKKSLSRIALEHGVAKSTVWNVLRKKEHFFPYKILGKQELFADDYNRRVNFCEDMTGRIHEDPTLVRRTIFTDESPFYISHAPNRKNNLMWCRENPHVFLECKTQYQVSINVWLGMVDGHLIGPFFIEERLSQEVYLNLLYNQVFSAMRRLSNYLS